ncbi:MAG: Hemerythrin HHE cation binding domain protein [Syntrophorhabdaceae bacterium PtaU1.Bin034]|jgi:hemerythrin-like domain-containing protein|nr:MAG: Hemerythrin HHE cation binding domain protein [Syntrophorhabdaceae bacterium PtaU1.Bin034]
MMPIAPLMIEHRLIERMIRVMKNELDLINKTGKARPEFIDQAVDFIRMYADRCHHGKEEDILFRQLSARSISDHYRQTMNELIQDHITARQMTSQLVAAKDRYVSGDSGAFDDIRNTMKELVTFYPVHIEKEDRHFFIPTMEYFDTREQDGMLEAFWEFDRMLIHEKYRSIVEKFEGKG